MLQTAFWTCHGWFSFGRRSYSPCREVSQRYAGHLHSAPGDQNNAAISDSVSFPADNHLPPMYSFVTGASEIFWALVLRTDFNLGICGILKCVLSDFLKGALCLFCGSEGHSNPSISEIHLPNAFIFKSTSPGGRGEGIPARNTSI